MTDDTAKTGTLAELGVMPGDRVMDGSGFEAYIVLHEGVRHILYPDWESPEGRPVVLETHNEFRIISRASDAPKTWGEMSEVEQLRIKVAGYEGKVIQYQPPHGWEWEDTTPSWYDRFAYRIKPEPKRETVTLWADYPDGSRSMRVGTIDLIDGEPIPGTYTNEKGDTIKVDRL